MLLHDRDGLSEPESEARKSTCLDKQRFLVSSLPTKRAAMALEPPPFDPLVSSGEITITPAHQSGGTQRFVEEDCGQARKEEKSRYDRCRIFEIQRSFEIGVDGK